MSEKQPIVVYTAITNGYDQIKTPPDTLGDDVNCIAFVDEHVRQTHGWQYHPVHSSFTDSNRNAKIHKLLPHRFFPKTEYSLWVDGSLTIDFHHSVQHLIDEHLAHADLAVFKHSLRTCVYQEAMACIHLKLDDPATIHQQMFRYTRDGYPMNNGLCECTVLLRRHTPAVNDFCEQWWKEICAGSRRDQLSFNYTLWKTGLKVEHFPGNLLFQQNELFTKYSHRRRR